MVKSSIKKKNSKLNFLILILIIIFAGVVIFSRNKDFDQKKYISPTKIPTSTIDIQKNLREEISYKLPLGWKENLEVEKDYSDYLVFTTSDYEPGYGIKGAQVMLGKEVVSPENFIDYVVSQSSLPDREVTRDEITVGTLNGRQTGYIVSCWEGCGLNYYLVNSDSIYRISYSCGTATNCYNKNGTIFESQYYPDFLSILQSLDFKE